MAHLSARDINCRGQEAPDKAVHVMKQREPICTRDGRIREKPLLRRWHDTVEAMGSIPFIQVAVAFEASKHQLDLGPKSLQFFQPTDRQIPMCTLCWHAAPRTVAGAAWSGAHAGAHAGMKACDEACIDARAHEQVCSDSHDAQGNANSGAITSRSAFEQHEKKRLHQTHLFSMPDTSGGSGVGEEEG